MPARLTIAEFMAELKAKTEREGTKWKLSPVGRLRTEDGACPLEELFGGDDDYAEIALLRGMTDEEIEEVVDAADFISTHFPEVRAQLLAATGAA